MLPVSSPNQEIIQSLEEKIHSFMEMLVQRLELANRRLEIVQRQACLVAAPQLKLTIASSFCTRHFTEVDFPPFRLQIVDVDTGQPAFLPAPAPVEIHLLDSSLNLVSNPNILCFTTMLPKITSECEVVGIRFLKVSSKHNGPFALECRVASNIQIDSVQTPKILVRSKRIMPTHRFKANPSRYDSVSSLPGIGERLGSRLKKMGFETIQDLAAVPAIEKATALELQQREQIFNELKFPHGTFNQRAFEDLITTAKQIVAKGCDEVGNRATTTPLSLTSSSPDSQDTFPLITTSPTGHKHFPPAFDLHSSPVAVTSPITQTQQLQFQFQPQFQSQPQPQFQFQPQPQFQSHTSPQPLLHPQSQFQFQSPPQPQFQPQFQPQLQPQFQPLLHPQFPSQLPQTQLQPSQQQPHPEPPQSQPLQSLPLPQTLQQVQPPLQNMSAPQFPIVDLTMPEDKFSNDNTGNLDNNNNNNNNNCFANSANMNTNWNHNNDLDLPNDNHDDDDDDDDEIISAQLDQQLEIFCQGLPPFSNDVPVTDDPFMLAIRLQSSRTGSFFDIDGLCFDPDLVSDGMFATTKQPRSQSSQVLDSGNFDVIPTRRSLDMKPTIVPSPTSPSLIPSTISPKHQHLLDRILAHPFPLHIAVASNNLTLSRAIFNHISKSPTANTTNTNTTTNNTNTNTNKGSHALNCENACGFTALMIACGLENLDAVAMLLSSPVIDVNASGAYTHTPLDISKAVNNKAMVELLVAKGATTRAARSLSPSSQTSSAFTSFSSISSSLPFVANQVQSAQQHVGKE